MHLPKKPRQASYLQRRSTARYFRFRLPGQIQSAAERSEIRVSLDTCELSIARERVAMLLPYVHSFKRLARDMHKLTSEHAQQVLDRYFTDIVEELGMHMSEARAQEFLDVMQGTIDAYDVVDSLPDYLPPVLYPRTAGVRQTCRRIFTR